MDQIQHSDQSTKLMSLIEELYPINRSITGDGVRKSLAILKQHVPLEIHEIPTGTKVLDWEVPKEWNVREAWVKNSKGEKIIDFSVSNLHLLNYSVPVHKEVDLSELKKHLFTLPDHPTWIPYRTSYYNENWGFCLAHNDYVKLKEDRYEVFIDSELSNGHLTYGEFYHPGESEEEFLFVTHICHPSLANDNLTGMSVAAQLGALLNTKSTRYSYRILFLPVTIGAITWLSLNEDRLDRIKFGLVLSLLGDKGPFHYKKSRRGDALIDTIVETYFQNSDVESELLEFSPYGYDERQFCSPGFNLPVGRLTRALHGEFPEYHTSADDLTFIDQKKLIESFEVISAIITMAENDRTFLNTNPKGEPQLGRRGLFKQIGGQHNTKEFQMALLWVLNLSDGENSLVDIAKKSGLDFYIINMATQALLAVNLLREVELIK
ncbi:DUF4910 domain-containing protein [Flavobacteriaceae bacterium F08102]|nr:DUF4910 domain-containing protein [Flavobacteriaceae bacterium F08102]